MSELLKKDEALITTFDYEQYNFSPEECFTLEEYSQKVQEELISYATLQLQGLQKFYTIGNYLRESKKIVDQRSPRSWVDWLENKFPQDPSMAYEAIKIAEFIDERGGKKVLVDLNPAIDKSSILQLSRAKTPEEIREFFWQKALAGDKVTNKEVRAAISSSATSTPAPAYVAPTIPEEPEENTSLYIDPEVSRETNSNKAQTTIFQLLENSSPVEELSSPEKRPISQKYQPGDLVTILMAREFGVDYREQRIWCHGHFGEVTQIRPDGKIDCNIAGREYSFFPEELQPPSANEADMPFLRAMHSLLSKICSNAAFPYTFPDSARAAIQNIKTRNIFNRQEIDFVEGIAQMLIPDWGGVSIVNVEAIAVGDEVEPTNGTKTKISEEPESISLLTEYSDEHFEELMYNSSYPEIFEMIENGKKEERVRIAEFWKQPTKGLSSFDLKTMLIHYFKQKEAEEMG